MTFEAITAEYKSITADLDEFEVTALWAAALFGRQLPSARIESRGQLLEALRSRISAEKPRDVKRSRLPTAADARAA